MMNMEKTKPARNEKAKKMKGVILMAIESRNSPPVRMARVVENYTKDALRDFVEDWAEEYNTYMDEDEINEIVNGLWNDGDKWWWDEEWCIQAYRD